MLLINMHDALPVSNIWESHCGQEFLKRKTVTQVVNIPLGLNSFASYGRIDSILNALSDHPEEREVAIFVSDVSVTPIHYLHALKASVSNRDIKLFGYLREEIGSNLRERADIAFDTMLPEIFDKLFVATEWHKYILERIGWPKESIYVVGHPLAERADALPVIPETVACIDIEEGLLFMLAVATRYAELHDDKVEFIFDPSPSAKYIETIIKGTELALENEESAVSVSIQPVALKNCAIMLTARSFNSFNYRLAKGVVNGSHPIAPLSGCYLEMFNRDRYTYRRNDVDDCVEKIHEALKLPSPPMSYLDFSAASKIAEHIVDSF